jgi:hypothetical protein
LQIAVKGNLETSNCHTFSHETSRNATPVRAANAARFGIIQVRKISGSPF